MSYPPPALLVETMLKYGIPVPNHLRGGQLFKTLWLNSVQFLVPKTLEKDQLNLFIIWSVVPGIRQDYHNDFLGP